MNSSITVDDRECITVYGVKSVERFTDSEVLLFTADGDLIIKGGEFSTKDFIPETKTVHIKGRVDSISFVTEKYHLADNFISRLFR